MFSVNKIIIIGRLGSDPEGTSFQDGGMIAKLSVATSQKWRNGNNEQQEHTEWHKVVLYNKVADFVMMNFKKGELIYIEGCIRHRQYQDGNNITRYVAEIHAEFIQSLA